MRQSLSKLFVWLGKAQSEDNEHPSSMRMNITNLSFQWVSVISIVTIWTAYKHPEYILALAGLLVGGILGALGVKAYQKGKEQDVPNTEVR